MPDERGPDPSAFCPGGDGSTESLQRYLARTITEAESVPICTGKQFTYKASTGR